MNSFADIKDRLVESVQALWLQIQENDSFLALKEKFQTLPQNYQTLIKVLGAFLVAYFVYSIPADIMAESVEKEEAFEENRELTRDIIKAGRLARTISIPPPAPKGQAFQSKVKSAIQSQRVLPNQMKPLSSKNNIAGKNLISKKVDQEGVVAKLSELNLQQVIHVSEDLDKIAGVRLINMTIQADKLNNHLFNVDYEVAAFSLDIKDEPIEKPGKKGKNKKKKKKKK